MMMTDREKLAEIVKSAGYRCLPSNTTDFHLERFVTDLLSFGVTVQRWIPVCERVPESGKDVVLVALRWGEVDVGWCEDGVWGSEFVNKYEYGEATHWMPLPEPPKGDE